jgi:hypothetical protein
MAMDRRPYPWKLTGDRQTSLPQPSVQDRITHILYRDGDGIRQDNNQARHFLELAAEQGHAKAQVAFASFF